MAFIESLLFPITISPGPIGGPGYSTDVVTVAGGHEQRNAGWSVPRRRYELSTSVKTQADFEAVRDVFYQARGRLHGFRFRDWSDYRATTANGVTVLTSGSSYQLQKRYASGSYLVDRNIVKPVAGMLTIWRTRGGTPSDITGSTTIDTATGIITVTGHVGGDVYTWSGEFHVPVRFDTDQLQAVVVAVLDSGSLQSWSSVPLIEVIGE